MTKLKSGTRIFVNENGKALMKFFAAAQIAYAKGEVAAVSNGGGSYELKYAQGCWSYDDMWCGGEPYMGMSVIRKDGVACFGLQYEGRIMPYADMDEVMKCLMEALQHPNPAHPWRGPREYVAKNGLVYRNFYSGDSSVRRLHGREVIMNSDGEETLYEATYTGRVVNQD